MSFKSRIVHDFTYWIEEFSDEHKRKRSVGALLSDRLDSDPWTDKELHLLEIHDRVVDQLKMFDPESIETTNVVILAHMNYLMGFDSVLGATPEQAIRIAKAVKKILMSQI